MLESTKHECIQAQCERNTCSARSKWEFAQVPSFFHQPVVDTTHYQEPALAPASCQADKRPYIHLSWKLGATRGQP